MKTETHTLYDTVLGISAALDQGSYTKRRNVTVTTLNLSTGSLHTHLAKLSLFFEQHLLTKREGVQFSAVLELCFCLELDTMAKDQ